MNPFIYGASFAANWSCPPFRLFGVRFSLGTVCEASVHGPAATLGAARFGWVLAVLSAMSTGRAGAQVVGAQDLGTLGGALSSASDVSADGLVVVGFAKTSAGAARAFRWTPSGGMQNLGILPGTTSSTASVVSANGAVVLGWASTDALFHERAFRWTASGGMQELGTLGYAASRATGTNADGTIIFGYVYNTSGYEHAFRWTVQAGMQELGSIDGTGLSVPIAMSADGSVLSGRANTASGAHAFRWTPTGGMQDLGALYGGGSAGVAISADGGVISGTTDGPAGFGRAFRWSLASGMQDLGTIPGNSYATGYGSEFMSTDGSVVVGGGLDQLSGNVFAFRWTPADGMQSLGNVIRLRAMSRDARAVVGYGFTGPNPHALRWTATDGLQDLGVAAGFVNSYANAVSTDGSVIVGQQIDSSGAIGHAFRWIVSTPAAGACCTGTACAVTDSTSCGTAMGVFQGSGSACGTASNPTTCCAANYNQVNGVNIQDIFDFLAAWFAGAPAADFNHSGQINIQDIFDFLAAWFAGC